MVPDVPEWFQTTKMVQSCQNGQILSEIIQIHLKNYLNGSGKTMSPGIVLRKYNVVFIIYITIFDQTSNESVRNTS